MYVNIIIIITIIILNLLLLLYKKLHNYETNSSASLQCKQFQFLKK